MGALLAICKYVVSFSICIHNRGRHDYEINRSLAPVQRCDDLRAVREDAKMGSRGCPPSLALSSFNIASHLESQSDGAAADGAEVR